MAAAMSNVRPAEPGGELGSLTHSLSLAAGVYGMRMARVNITLPDDLLERARAAGLNVSRMAASALSEEFDRRAKITALDSYLRELEVELGPISSDEQVAARDWADRALDDSRRRSSGRASQPA